MNGNVITYFYKLILSRLDNIQYGDQETLIKG